MRPTFGFGGLQKVGQFAPAAGNAGSSCRCALVVARFFALAVLVAQATSSLVQR